MKTQILAIASMACILGATSAEAQVVQLPTYRIFSIGTTVSIPDRGGAYLGGVTRGTWSSNSRGVPGLSQVPGLNRAFMNRGIGSSVSSSQAFATATIIDHAEMDQMLLAEAAARHGEREIASDVDRRAAFLSTYVAKSPASPVASSMTGDRAVSVEVAARLASANAQQREEMASYLQRAEAAEAAGRWGAARCCYDVLARRGSDAQRGLAARRLAGLKEPRTDDKLASRED